MIRSLPTRDGWIALVLALALVQVGAMGGNNLVVLVGCLGLAALWVDVAAGRWNLRGVEVRWALPEELFAGVPCRGAFLVRNTRHRGALGRIGVDDGVASAAVDGVPPGGEQLVRAWWRFDRRGPFALDAVNLGSDWPFGLFQHQRSLPARAQGLVCPRPVVGQGVPDGVSDGEGVAARDPDPSGDLRDLRPYRPGDRLRSIHWRTSARVGAPMVADREGDAGAGVLVVVRPDAPREQELERATGSVLEAFGRGRSVGLVMPGDRSLAAPSRGTRWRRCLLDALATAPAGPSP